MTKHLATVALPFGTRTSATGHLIVRAYLLGLPDQEEAANGALQ